MDAVSRARFQRYGLRKVNQVCGEIRGITVGRAQRVLPTLSRRSVTLVEKTLRSAAANLAVKLGRPVDLEEIFVRSAWVGPGPMKHLKRVRPAPMGRAMMIRRKLCHLTIVVSDKK